MWIRFLATGQYLCATWRFHDLDLKQFKRICKFNAITKL